MNSEDKIIHCAGVSFLAHVLILVLTFHANVQNTMQDNRDEINIHLVQAVLENKSEDQKSKNILNESKPNVSKLETLIRQTEAPVVVPQTVPKQISTRKINTKQKAESKIIPTIIPVQSQESAETSNILLTASSEQPSNQIVSELSEVDNLSLSTNQSIIETTVKIQTDHSIQEASNERKRYWSQVRDRIARELKYPNTARKKKLEEYVVVRIAIDRLGKLQMVEALEPIASVELKNTALR